MKTRNTFEGFLRDNPELKLVEASPKKALLLWAHNKQYISLRKVEGHYLFTEFQLEVAEMWAGKDDSAKSALKTFKLLVKYNTPKGEFIPYGLYSTEADAVAMGHILAEKTRDVVEFEVIEVE
nr:MAG TPA: hypothetical protein [Caudoviricetes sp.]